MEFAYPQGRIYLVLALAVAVLAVLALVRKWRALRLLAEKGIHQPGMLTRPGRQILKCGLLILAAALLGIAVLGPQWGWTEDEMPPRRGRDVLILLDVSRSMLAEDVAPNRLGRAKAELRSLADLLEQSDAYRIGLITFAERSAVLCPLTSDYRCFGEELTAASLESLRLRGHAHWGDGTQIRRALERAGQAIDDANAGYTDVLLVSDGEDMDRESLKAAKSLADRGIVVHALGLGDPEQGSPIPVRDSLGRPAHLHYQGERVQTHLQEEGLRAIAETTHGRYFAARTSYLDLAHQFGELLAGKERLEREIVHRERRGIHRFAWFVAPALVLLLLHGLFSEVRRPGRAPAEQPNYFSWVRRGTNNRSTESGESEKTKVRKSILYLAGKCVVICTLCSSVIGSSPTGAPWTDFQRGNELLRQAQQAGANADAASLLEAQQHYEECLSRLRTVPEAGKLLENARHNLEMARLMQMQLSSDKADADQQEAKEPRSASQESEARERANEKQGSPTENEKQPKEKQQETGGSASSSSKQSQQQQSQENSASCACQTGQNHSANGNKTKEGGDGSQSGRRTRSSAGLTPGGDERRKEGRDRGPEPDASGLFHAETSGSNPRKSTSSQGDGDSAGAGLGKGKTAHTMDPLAQAAIMRLQASIRRIENHRGKSGRGSASGPEDPANMNRYRDW